MKKGNINIYAFIAAFLMMTGIFSCSDNSDPALRPTANSRYLSLEAEGQTANDDESGGNITFTRNSDLDTIVVNVSSNTLWKVDISGGGWCSVSTSRGSGKGEFSIFILNNRSNESRKATVSVTQVDKDGNKYNNDRPLQIIIDQAGSQIFITPSSVDIFAAENPREQEFEIIANAEWTLSIRAEDNQPVNFVTISSAEGMEKIPGSEQTFTGKSNARFKIVLQNSGMPVVRKAFLELKSENGNYSVEISQQKSDYTFDVSPNTTRYIPAEGDELKFEVYSPTAGWTISIPNDDDPEENWIKCPTIEFERSDKRVTVNMTVEPNYSGRERPKTIFFKSNNSAYSEVPVLVVQRGFDMDFKVNLNDNPGVIMEDGGSFSFSVNSMFRWRVARTDAWISVVVPSDIIDGSKDAVTVEVEVGKNTTHGHRNTTISVIPLPTEFATGITIDPDSVGISPVTIPVTQFGGQKPAISTPWLLDGYYTESERQSMAQLEFSYFSPSLSIATAELQWKKETDPEDAWQVAGVTNVSDHPHAGTITVTLQGLTPGTNYVARGYVVDTAGTPHPGSATVPFKTAGRVPGSGDNPTPTR